MRLEDVPVPKTAADALRLWDAGHKVRAFRVESEDAGQEVIYGVAFDIIAGRNPGFVGSKPAELTIREYEVALSIVHVAKLKGWKKMVREHTDSGHIPEILVWKPKAPDAAA